MVTQNLPAEAHGFYAINCFRQLLADWLAGYQELPLWFACLQSVVGPYIFLSLLTEALTSCSKVAACTNQSPHKGLPRGRFLSLLVG